MLGAGWRGGWSTCEGEEWSVTERERACMGLDTGHESTGPCMKKGRECHRKWPRELLRELTQLTDHTACVAQGVVAAQLAVIRDIGQRGLSSPRADRARAAGAAVANLRWTAWIYMISMDLRNR